MVAPSLAVKGRKSDRSVSGPAQSRPLLEAAPVKQQETVFLSKQRDYPATFGKPFEFGVPLEFDRCPVLFTGTLDL